MDDSFIVLPKSHKTSSTSDGKSKRPVARLKADKLEIGDALRGAHTECPICRKNLESLSELRRANHVNNCVNSSVNEKAFEDATKMAESMFTCPFCNEPVAKGPYLIAHANKCSKLFDLSAAKVITALELQSQVVDQLRKKGINRAVPVTSAMIRKAKKRALEEEEEKNSSESDASRNEPSPKLVKPSGGRFIPGMLKSAVFGAKEKHVCRCEGLHVIQDRFCGQFKKKKIPKVDHAKEILENNLFRKQLSKVDRLSRLADDFKKTLFGEKGDITLITKNNVKIFVHSFVMKARTTMITSPTTTEVLLDDFSTEVIEYYIQYVYSASIEWSMNEMEDIRKLASLYGPTDLYFMMTQSDDVYHSSNIGGFTQRFDDVNNFDPVDVVEFPSTSMRKNSWSPVLFESFQENSIKIVKDVVETPLKEVVENPVKEVVEKVVSRSQSPDSIIIEDVIICGSKAKPSISDKLVSPILDKSITPKPLQSILKESTARSIQAQPSVSNDSFFHNDSMFDAAPAAQVAPSTPTHRILSLVSPVLSPTTKAKKLATKLRSGIKVVKFNNITPMPAYEKFTEAELKGALAVFGLRPCGRKTAIETLKKIYDELHPVITDITAANTPRRRISPISFDTENATSEASNGSQENLDELLNQSQEENPEESLFFDGDESLGPPTGTSPAKQPKQIKDVEVAVKAMLEWLRLPENEELYCNLLAFRTINLDELMGLLARSHHSVRKITKKILPDVLDKLYIAFYIPDKKWKRRAGYKSG